LLTRIGVLERRILLLEERLLEENLSARNWRTHLGYYVDPID
jgi:hypothetical protein